ncbi:hypothetical protein [Streptomyces sp. NPDC050263]|uniref:hypothetical protein n=1 Tax=Streptomyces sp. NPDC050263 TaxID=3155037 RepID=UPI0034434E97
MRWSLTMSSVACLEMTGLCSPTSWEIVSISAVYPSLTRALVDVLWLFEDRGHEQTDQDDGGRVLEGVAHLVSWLSREQQHEFRSLLAAMAREESDPSRRVFLEELQQAEACVADLPVETEDGHVPSVSAQRSAR